MASSGLNKNMLDVLIFSNKLTLYNVNITVILRNIYWITDDTNESLCINFVY